MNNTPEISQVFKDQIVRCVTESIKFNTGYNTTTDICALMCKWDTNLASINKIGDVLNNQLLAMPAKDWKQDTDGDSAATELLRFKLDTIKNVRQFHLDVDRAEKNAEKKRADALRRKALIEAELARKEVADLGAAAEDLLTKELDEINALLG